MTILKKKTTLVFVVTIYLTVFSCASHRTEETSADSTVVTAAVETPTPPASVPNEEEEAVDVNLTEAVAFNERQSFNIKSFYSSEIYSDSSTEESIQTTLDSLISAYDALTLTTLESNYEVSYEVGNDYDEGKETVSQSEQTIWWYDSLMRLRAYANILKNVSTDRTTLYLFDKGRMTGYYTDVLLGGQDTQVFKERGVVFQGPDCVVKMEMPYSGKPTGRNVSVYKEDYLEGLNNSFISDYKVLVKLLRRESISRTKDGDYEYEIKDNFAGSPFVITYSATEPVQKYLLNK